MLKAPTTTDPPSFDDIDRALRRAEAATDAAEAHGSLCGLVCGLGARGPSVWLAETLAETPEQPPASAAVAEQAGAVLGQLAASTRAALEDAEMAFQPLLPDDAEPLAERVDGLAQWCQGFNHGLFVAARIGTAEAELDSGNTAEVVRDFGAMAEVAVGDDEADADGEAAYAELVEYVRVGVQLVYEELTEVRQRVESAGRH
jgi:yecA family protein